MLVPLNMAVWYGPDMMGGVVSEIEMTQSLDARGLGSMGVVNWTVVANSLGLLEARFMALQNTVSPGAIISMIGQTRMGMVSKVNELSQSDVTGAVLEAEVEPGLTLKQALIDARKAAKLAAVLSA